MKKKFSIKEKKIIERSIVLSDFQKQSFSKQIQDFQEKIMPYNENFYLGVTPKILKINGAKYDKLVLAQKGLIKIHIQHHLNFDIIEKIPEYLNMPYLVIKGSSDNTFACILELKNDTNKEILVSINIEANEGYMNVSRVTSAYGKKGLNSYLTNKERKVLDFYNKKRTNQWLASRGLQLPKLSNNDSSFNYIIC